MHTTQHAQHAHNSQCTALTVCPSARRWVVDEFLYPGADSSPLPLWYKDQTLERCVNVAHTHTDTHTSTHTCTLTLMRINTYASTHYISKPN